MQHTLHANSTCCISTNIVIISFCVRDTTSWQLTGCTVVTFALWLVGVFTLRYSLKLLLIYKGWMYEERGRGRQISTATKLWVLLVRVLSGWNKPKLYSFQGSLPRLPLPSLHCTMQRVGIFTFTANKF